MKTCGLEILLSRVKHKWVGVDEAASDDKNVEVDPRWLKFVKSLESKGFFQNEIEGSRLHQQLLSSAKEYFVAHLQDEETEEGPML